MICKPIKERKKWVLLALSVTVIVLLYSWISWNQHTINPKQTVIPNGVQFLEGFQKIIKPDLRGERWIVEDVKASGERLFFGITLGLGLAITVGMATGCHAPTEAVLLGPITFFSRIPPAALIAVYFVAFGTGENLFIAMIALGIFPSMAVAIHSSIKKDVQEELIFKSYTLGASHLETATEVVFKQIFPRILQNLQLHIGPAMVFLIAAEMLLSDVGFGYRLRMQSRLLNMNVVYLYLIVLAVSGVAIDWLLVRIRRWMCPWFGE